MSTDATPPDPLLPTDEHGNSRLIVGGARGDRATALSTELDAFAKTPGGPLVVIVRASPGTSLDEALASAAEDALRAHGAPGALYDDPSGGPLAALGGWLFRARAIGRRGVLVAIDEIDGWLETRGRPGAPSANELIFRALEETARRPFSLVATVRAADASGAPALPAELVRRFGSTRALGGAANATRDPWVLVAALAGRSFTLGAIKQALGSWLELPDNVGDDAVVVFSSPLGPPHVGTLPEGEMFDFAAATSPARDETPAVAATEQHAPLLGEGWADALRAAMDVRDGVNALAGASVPHGFKQIERMLRDGAAKLPFAFDALVRAEQALGIEPTRMRAAAERALAAFDARFRASYPDMFATWLAGAPRPTMLCDLPQRLAHLATERGARGTALVVITGLRVDLWPRFRSRVLARVPGLVGLDEGLLWAARPTTPETQRELLARGLDALRADLPVRDRPTAPRTLAEALRPRREHLGRVEVLRIDAYASELAASAEPMITVAERVEQALPSVLLTLCGGFAGRTVLAITGDVGIGDSGEPAPGRHRFGGDSPFEAVVPYALLTWG